MRKITFLIIILAILSSCSKLEKTSADYVNPFIGTGGHGHTFPGATVPFGMVQLSPDTRVDGSWDGCGGYHYSDSIIYGFSHTHLSGTGVSDYGDIMLMPSVSKPSFDNKEYASEYSHKNEVANAGYYSVKLNNGVEVALTASTRVGFHQYKFQGDDAYVILDLMHRDALTEGSVDIINNTTIAVKRLSNAWATEQHAYAYIEFSEPFETEFNDDKTKVIFHFNGIKELQTKVGFSLVSIDGAKKNLEAEIPHWDFDKTKQDAFDTWNKELSKIEVTDKDQNKLEIFYTALYHTMIHPNIAMDVDHQYRGRDNQIHTAEGFDYYTVFSLWDTFRATHPLYTIIDRKRTLDFIKTFLAQYQQGGRLPVWELACNETDCMIGYHSVSVIADALAKNINDFDKELALEAMEKSATWNHLGLPAYMEHGHLTMEDEHESVSKTLEYAYDDWCIAQVAKLLGKNEDYETYMTRSQSWKNLLDPTTKFMRPKKNGGWLTPFEPREVNNHFTEGNSWQYSFFVPQDIYGLAKAMGGDDAFEHKLDELFTTSSQTTGREQADITGLIGQYAHGNEPSHHMAYLYSYVGKPSKTQEKINQILNEFYTTHPDGLIGNEDCGQMSAWYVLSSMGLYQVTPGTDYFVFGKPHFDNVKIHLENGKTLEINAAGLSKENIYVNGVKFNNEDYTKSCITYNEMESGGNLTFELTNKANGKCYTELPPSNETNTPIITTPIIHSTKRYFKDTLQLSITSSGKNKIYYAINGEKFIEYSSKIILTNTCEVKTFSEDSLGNKSYTMAGSFYKKPNNWDISINSTYNPQYTAGGDEGLIDGIKGNENWRKGDWQGFQDQDFEAIIDLKTTKTISTFSARFLQDTRAWIVMPTKVEFYISNNDKDYVLISKINNTVEPNDYKVQVKEFKDVVYPKETRYVKVKAYNFGTLPEWHLGYGGEAFIFIDEIELK